MADYKIPRSEFSQFIWLKDEHLFENFDLIELDFETPGSFELQLITNSEKELASQKNDNKHGGWHTFSYDNFHFPYEKFKIKIVSYSGKLVLRGGNVQRYDL